MTEWEDGDQPERTEQSPSPPIAMRNGSPGRTGAHRGHRGQCAGEHHLAGLERHAKAAQRAGQQAIALNGEPSAAAPEPVTKTSPLRSSTMPQVKRPMSYGLTA